jgi:hypothetical protein
MSHDRLDDTHEDPAAGDPDDREADGEVLTMLDLAAMLLRLGFDAGVVGHSLVAITDTILARTKPRWLEAWLDSIPEEPLLPDEVAAILVYVAQHAKEAPRG